MPLKYQLANYPDLSKGITDKRIDGENGKAELIENLIPASDGTLVTIDGFDFKYERETIAPITWIGRLPYVNSGDSLLFIRSNRLYSLNESTGIAIPVETPNNVDLFSHSNHPIDADDVVSFIESQGRVMVTNSASSIPMIILDAKFKTTISSTTPLHDGLVAIRAGLPLPYGNIVVSGGGSGSLNYKYRLHYRLLYEINGVNYLLVGPTLDISANNKANTDMTISGWVKPPPELRVFHKATYIDIYRTQNNRSTYYQIGARLLPQNSSVGTLFDGTPDSALVIGGRPKVYDDNEGGIKTQYPAPRCSALSINNEVVYYLSTFEDIPLMGGGSYEEKFYTRIVQGSVGSFGLCSPDDSEMLADDVIGGGSHNGKSVIFTKTYIYRIEGVVDTNGLGFIRPTVINRSVGCLGARSIIETSNGIMFVGNTGIYITDGFQVQPVDLGLTQYFSDLFKPWKANNKIYSSFDKRKEIVYWLVSDDTANDMILVYSLLTGGFTTVKAVGMESRCLYQDEFDLLRGEYNGNIFVHNRENKGFIIPLYGAGGQLLRKKRYAIPYKYRSVIDGLGSPMIRKWGKKINITFESEYDLCVGIKSRNDDGTASKEMQEIRHFGSWVWRDDNFFWGNPDTTWRRPATATHSRHFPKRSLRFRRKQIEIYPEETILFKSDLFGNATVLLNVINPDIPRRYEITLNSGDYWPSDVIDYSILIDGIRALIEEVDGKKIITYGTQFRQSNDAKWEIIGINKSQEVKLHSYSFLYAPLREIGDNYQKENSGKNE